jgi:hypothetical protein
VQPQNPPSTPRTGSDPDNPYAGAYPHRATTSADVPSVDPPSAPAAFPSQVPLNAASYVDDPNPYGQPNPYGGSRTATPVPTSPRASISPPPAPAPTPAPAASRTTDWGAEFQRFVGGNELWFILGALIVISTLLPWYGLTAAGKDFAEFNDISFGWWDRTPWKMSDWDALDTISDVGWGLLVPGLAFPLFARAKRFGWALACAVAAAGTSLWVIIDILAQDPAETGYNLTWGAWFALIVSGVALLAAWSEYSPTRKGSDTSSNPSP